MAATLGALGLLLCAQLCCAMRWSFERKMLIAFHGGLAIVLLIIDGILIQWLNSSSSPRQYDITPASINIYNPSYLRNNFSRKFTSGC